jgi:hypothetical protein
MLTRDTADTFRRQIANLQPGDTVRVEFSDGVVAVGTLRGPSLIDSPSQKLILDSHVRCWEVRHPSGAPGWGVRSVQAWDDDARFDALLLIAQDYLSYQESLRTCEPSERGGLEKCAAEAKEAFLAEWRQGVQG